MKKNIFSTGLFWLWVSVLVFVVDQITKQLSLAYLIPYDPYPVTNFFNLTLAFNRGAAFSFLNNVSGWQTLIFGTLAVIVTAIILVRLKQIPARKRFVGVSLTLIVGGALGNLFDRIHYGYVIDFIELHVSSWHWPVFNIADSAICVGATMLFIDMLFLAKK